MNIIDEIAEARHYFLYHDLEPNIVIIPAHRQGEINTAFTDFVTRMSITSDGKKYVFGCEIIYAIDVDKIKVAYTP